MKEKGQFELFKPTEEQLQGPEGLEPNLTPYDHEGITKGASDLHKEPPEEREYEYMPPGGESEGGVSKEIWDRNYHFCRCLSNKGLTMVVNSEIDLEATSLDELIKLMREAGILIQEPQMTEVTREHFERVLSIKSFAKRFRAAAKIILEERNSEG